MSVAKDSSQRSKRLVSICELLWKLEQEHEREIGTLQQENADLLRSLQPNDIERISLSSHEPESIDDNPAASMPTHGETQKSMHHSPPPLHLDVDDEEESVHVISELMGTIPAKTPSVHSDSCPAVTSTDTGNSAGKSRRTRFTKSVTSPELLESCRNQKQSMASLSTTPTAIMSTADVVARDVWSSLLTGGDVMAKMDPASQKEMCFTAWRNLTVLLNVKFHFAIYDDWERKSVMKQGAKSSGLNVRSSNTTSPKGTGSSTLATLKLGRSDTSQRSHQKMALEENPHQGKCSRVIISPTSGLRLAWDLLGMAFLIVDMILIPLRMFGLENFSFITFSDWSAIVFWTLDIPASLVTAYMNNGVIIYDFNRIVWNYVKTGLLVDMIVVVPDWVFKFVDSLDRSAGSTSKVLKTLRIVRTVRLLRLTKLNRIMAILKDRIDSEAVFILLNIVKKILILLMINHFLCTAWYMIGQTSDDNWIKLAGYEDDSVGAKYTASLHWTLTQFTPASMDIQPVSVQERAFAITVLVMGLVYFSSFVSSITTSMAQLGHMKEKQAKEYWLLRRYLRQHGVSSDLTIRTLNFVEAAWRDKRDLVPEMAVTALKMLSHQLKDELRYEVNFMCMSVHPLFAIVQHRSPGTLLRLVHNTLAHQVYAPGDTVFDARAMAEQMYIVSSGAFQYLKTDSLGNTDSEGHEFHSCDSILSTMPSIEAKTPWLDLEQDNFLSEPCLWTEWVHLGLVQATTNANMVAVKSESFMIDCKADEETRCFMVHYGRRYIERLNKRPLRQLSDFCFDADLQELIELCCEAESSDEEDNEVQSPHNGLDKLIHGLKNPIKQVINATKHHHHHHVRRQSTIKKKIQQRRASNCSSVSHKKKDSIDSLGDFINLQGSQHNEKKSGQHPGNRVSCSSSTFATTSSAASGQAVGSFGSVQSRSNRLAEDDPNVMQAMTTSSHLW